MIPAIIIKKVPIIVFWFGTSLYIIYPQKAASITVKYTNGAAKDALMTFKASMKKKWPMVANKPKQNIRIVSFKLGHFQKIIINGADKNVPVMAVNKRVVWFESDELRNFVDIVKKAKHKAAKNGNIIARLNDWLFGSAIIMAPISPTMTTIIWRKDIFSFKIKKANIVVITGPII